MFPPVTDDLVQRYDIPAPRYTSYPTAPMWSEKVGPQAFADALALADARAQDPLSLYVHIPFCRERCSFCGCNVTIARRSSTADRYLDAVEREIDAVASHLPHRRTLSQIHWGGGTPTFLDEKQLTRLWTAIASRFRVLPTAEVSVEVNPEVTTHGQLDLLRSFGFNRVSMGVQDLDHGVQEAIRRNQDIALTGQMLNHARKLGFSGINFDLIYGLPRQTPESWAKTIKDVIGLRPDRLAVYGFAFLPQMKPHMKRLQQFGVPTGKDKLNLFKIAYEAFQAAGYKTIGMDHFSLPEDELSKAQARRGLTRNFQGYTVSAASDVIAIGASAISDVSGVYAQNPHVLPAYEARALTGKLCTERGFACSEDDRRRRKVINDVMCNFYVDLREEQARFAPELEQLKALEAQGLLTVKGGEVELTLTGRVFVRNVACVFDTYLGKSEARFSRAV